MKVIDFLKLPLSLVDENPIPLTMEYYEYLKDLDPAFYEHLKNRDPKQHTSRTFRHICVWNHIYLSVQASFVHNCSPRLSLPVDEYDSMELAFFKYMDMVPAEKVIRNTPLIRKVNRYRSNDRMIYSNVPVELIEEIYESTKAYYESKAK